MSEAIVEDSYVVLRAGNDEEEEMEEELNINWCIFCSRFSTVVMIVLMIILFGLGKVDSKFFILASIVLGVLIMCFAASFLTCCKRRFFVKSYANRFAPVTRESSKFTNHETSNHVPFVQHILGEVNT